MPYLKTRLLVFVVPALAIAAAFGNVSTSPDSPPAPPASTPDWASNTDTRIALLQERLRLLPKDVTASLKLGVAYLERARETADPSYYHRAEGVLLGALAQRPDEAPVLVALGSLALARHQFQEALDLGRQAADVNPDLAAAYGVIGDAQVELGRYEEAFDAYQQMIDRRPDLASLARASHARELTGDIPGAIEAMRRAAESGGATGEAAAWAATQLGDLLWTYEAGALGAERAYQSALKRQPGYPPALAGLAKIAWAGGAFDESLNLARRAANALPSLEHAVLVSDLLHAVGRREEARAQDEFVKVIELLSEASGVRPDAEQVLFEADRGDPRAAVESARDLYVTSPGPKTAGVLAWSLHRSGRSEEASALIPQALSWGARHPATRYRAAAIALAIGDDRMAAEHLDMIANPRFSPRYVAELRVVGGAR